MDWHFEKQLNKFELIYKDLDIPSTGVVIHTGYYSDKLLDILEAGYYLKGYYWHPHLTERQSKILDAINLEVMREVGADGY